jgi:aminoglycoside 3-N-acetyltransferase
MKPLTRSDIVRGLRKIGLEEGDRVLVHSSLAALGHVDGGADSVIDALLETVGPEGLVVVPTFGGAPFDRKKSATTLGIIADTFWRRQEAVRSLHPSHSVAAIGKGAEELIRGHEMARTAYGEDTPYMRLAETGGKILLVGVDQDRNTTLHTGESIACVPYMGVVDFTYVDDDGKEVTIPVEDMAGPHRDFIGLDRLFRELGIMAIGRIGNAVCRLMDTKEMLEAEIEALEEDPAAVLCDNPSCADCVMQRGKIKAARLAQEDFTLAAVSYDISCDPEEVLATIQGEGILALEIAADGHCGCREVLDKAGVKITAVRGGLGDASGLKLAHKLGVPFIVPVRNREDMEAAAKMEGGVVLIENDGAPSSEFKKAYSEIPNLPKLAFNPRNFAAAGEKPFLDVFYRGWVRRHTARFYIDDGVFGGKKTFPGRGNGEVKEIMSMLRCRGFDGVMTLRSHDGDVETFREAAAWFWELLDTM